MFLREPSKLHYTYEGEASWVLRILQVDRSLQGSKGDSSLRVLNHIQGPVKGARQFHLKISMGRRRSIDGSGPASQKEVFGENGITRGTRGSQGI